MDGPSQSLPKVDLPDRAFRIWKYAAGHSWLLLRSPMSVDTASEGRLFATRVDVLFTYVHAIQLPTFLTGLTISVLEGEPAQTVLGDIGRRPDHTQKVFALTGSDYRGCLIAGHVTVAEDEGGYDEPSKIWSVEYGYFG